MYEYVANTIRVVDGDTVEAEVDLGFGIVASFMFRLYEINAPEMRGPGKDKGKKAKEHLQSLVNKHEPLVVKTIKDKQGKYGRYLAILLSQEGSLNLNALMVADGHAVKQDY